jgi:hypothetical protein
MDVHVNITGHTLKIVLHKTHTMNYDDMYYMVKKLQFDNQIKE